MRFQEYSIREIRNYLANLGEDELRNSLEYLQADRRKAVKDLVMQKQRLLANGLKEWNRLLKMWQFEAKLYQQNYQHIVGVDEVGRGPLAGPVVAGAVILPANCIIQDLNDSKKVAADKRALLSTIIKAKALAWGVGVVDSATIDKINILNATRYAMELAVNSLSIQPDYALIDGQKNPLLTIPQSAIVKGDTLSASIAAASILAKVHRDNLMNVYDDLYPGYLFSVHKGYGTKNHLLQIKKLGPCPIHRYSFKPVKNQHIIV